MPKELSKPKSRSRGAAAGVKLWGHAYLAAVSVFACGTTPLDSVIAERVTNSGGTDVGGSETGGTATSGSGGTGAESGSLVGGSRSSGGSDITDAGSAGAGGGAGSGDCQGPVPGPGSYYVRDRVGDRCLQKGDADPVLHAPVYSALLDGDCSVPEAQWDFREIMGSFYALHNAGIDANLDVRAGSTTDGTPIVMYTPQPLPNQLFAILPRTPPYFALEPRNAVNKCVEAIGAGAQLFPCDDTNQAQDFSLVRVDCP